MSGPRSVPPLRIAVLGDFEGMHTRRWVEVFVQRGHDMHAISYYPPLDLLNLLPSANVHALVLPDGSRSDGQSTRERTHYPPPGPRASVLRSARDALPPSLQRVINAQRYMRAGLRRVLKEVQPDVFHAHYAVEHGFYGSFAGFHPYVVSTWGSDLLVESHRPFGRLIARRALGEADLVTANDASLARRAAELGVPAERIEVVHLGIDRLFLDAGERSVNLLPEADGPPTVVSTRAHERLYNLDAVLRAFAIARREVPDARLVVAGSGSRTDELQALASALSLGEAVQFVGQQPAPELAGLLAGAHVYVSVPTSDSFALSNVEAMAAGVFPVVSDLPSVDGWLQDGSTGLRIPPGHVQALASALARALKDASLRRSAAEQNRAKVEAEGLRERNMLLMERHYYRLAGRPQAGLGEAI